MLPARQQHRGLRLRPRAQRGCPTAAVRLDSPPILLFSNAGQFGAVSSARGSAHSRACADLAGVADRCSVAAYRRKVKIFLTSRVDTKGWLILLKVSRATCTGARAVGSNLRIGYEASLARPGDGSRFLRDGPTEVGPPSWSPPRRSLTSQLKKGKRRRRSPGGSIPYTPVYGGSQTDSGDTAFQPSP
jgi:hypothetical protein